MTRMLRTSPLTSHLLPSLLATALLAGSVGAASAAPHAKSKPHAAAARKAKPAPAEQAMTTDASGQSIPVLENKAWVLMDFNTGQLLASSNPDEPLPPASLTKMMTSYLVEQGLKSGKVKPDDKVTMSESAWCRGGKDGDSCMASSSPAATTPPRRWPNTSAARRPASSP
jgi:D-alanyl-D-alanine carboxypeptidase (penicillin-binding protein 5/6)